MYRIQIIVLIIIAFLSPFLYAGRALCWEVKRSEHAEVFYHEEDLSLAIRVSSLIERGYGRVAGRIGFFEDVTVRVFLTSSDEEFNSMTGDVIPDWGVGCALPERRVIILRHGGKVKLNELVLHELSHILLWQATGGGRVPHWFNEGVAVWQSREWRMGQSITMAKAVLLKQVIPLHEIDSMLSFSSSRAYLAYTESFLALVYLFEIGGRGVLQRIAERMLEGQDFDHALYEASGYLRDEFEKSWEGYVRRKYNPISILLDSFNLWLAIFALFLIVYFIKRWRMKKILVQWEMEEEGSDGNEDVWSVIE
ncbi:MAG TPA: hypothetical protein EYP53_03425 [Candidatus Latescibacteria bacterium]|nr:hypothetical protein [Candidatus Latescibacterota bacterium]